MSAARFLQLLEKRGMLDSATIAELRAQISDPSVRVTAESIAKALVEKGHLTKFQATSMVGEVTEDKKETTSAKRKRKQKKSPSAKPPAPVEDDLGLAPLGDEGEDEAPRAPASPSPPEEDVVMLEDAADGLTPVEDAGAGLTPIASDRTPVAPNPTPGGTGLTPIGGGPAPPPAPTPGLSPLPGDLGNMNMGPDPTSSEGFPTASSQAPVLPSKIKKKRIASWGSMLMYGAAIALPLLIFFGVMLYINLTKTPAVEMFEKAMEFYRSESYSQSKAQFEAYLHKYPNDEQASEARVRIALCEMRLAVDAGPQKGLDSIKELIPTVSSEEEFNKAREEFGGFLFDIPQDFVAAAKATDDMKLAEEQVNLARESLDFILDPSNLPTSMRTGNVKTQADRIEEDIKLVRRAIEQDQKLQAAITEIEGAVADGDTQSAYQIYRDLLKIYPGVERNEPLLAAVRQITEKVRGLVVPLEEPPSPLTDESEDLAEFRVTLASRSAQGSTLAEGQAAPVLAGGSVYCVNAGTGKPLWRRYVGPETTFFPLHVSSDADSDVLLADSHRQEVVRRKAASGELVWRLPMGELFSDPVIAGSKTYVTTNSGKFLEIATETGEARRGAQLPQTTTAPAGIAPTRPRAFVPGEHSNLYVMSTDTLECKDVFYLGHKPNSVTLPPLVLMKFVFVVENAGRDYSLLHILTIKNEGDGSSLERSQPPIRFQGNIRVPILVYGKRRVLVLTDRGEIRVYDVDPIAAESPVKEAAAKTAMHSQPVIGYPLTDATSLWIADNRLTNYRVMVTTKEITMDPNVANVGDTFTAPLQQFQDTLVHVRRRRDSAGYTIAGVNIDNTRKPLWETHVGVPAGRVAVDIDQKKILAISAAASLFEINRDALSRGTADEATVTARGSGSRDFIEAIDLPGGRVALFNPADHQRILLFSGVGAPSPLKIVPWKLADVRLSASPIALQDGLLLPLQRGAVAFVDPATGGEKTLPFQPRLEPGETIAWRRPTRIETADDEFLIADDRKNLYQVKIKQQPEPFLAEIKKVPLDVQITSSLASVGDTLYGAANSDNGDVIVAITVKDLKLAQKWELDGGRVTWGPHRIQNTVLLAVDGKQLWALGADGKPRWKEPASLPAQPVGVPILDGSDFLFAAHDGTVWRALGTTGKTAGISSVGEPLRAGPVAYEGRLLLSGNDGTLHVIPMPKGS